MQKSFHPQDLVPLPVILQQLGMLSLHPPRRSPSSPLHQDGWVWPA